VEVGPGTPIGRDEVWNVVLAVAEAVFGAWVQRADGNSAVVVAGKFGLLGKHNPGQLFITTTTTIITIKSRFQQPHSTVFVYSFISCSYTPAFNSSLFLKINNKTFPANSTTLL
jgi:hypothetical protein